jgi:Trk-type K+ transport system membrane component
MSHLLQTAQRSTLLSVLNVVLVLCSVCALGLLVCFVGWPVPAEWETTLRLTSRCVLGTFAVQEFARILLQTDPLDYVRRHKLEVFLTLLAASEIFLGTTLHARLGGGISAGSFTILYLGASQLILLLLIGIRALRNSTFLGGRRLSPGLLFMLTFGLLIAAGTFLLKTPNATTHGIAWIDALFTSASAMSVTGLTTLDIAKDFTFTGQCIILCLVQIGGLGIMTFTYFLAYFLAGGVSIRSRYAIQDILSEDNIGQIGAVLGTIIVFTFGCEAVGAAILYSQLEIEIAAPQFLESLFSQTGAGIEADDRLFFSIFHSVTAFCNAGFSTLGGNLADPALKGLDGVMLTITALVLAGGIGFPVVKNCWQHLFAVFLRRVGVRSSMPPRLESNTKLVLVTSAVLCVGGAAAIYVTENLLSGSAPRPDSPHSPLLTAVFDSFSARTAGFTPTTGRLFADTTAIIMMFLMFVGGGPSSTAGGIKTTTLGVAFLSLRRVVQGRDDIEAFGRRLDDSVAHRALATILLALIFTIIISLLLCALEPKLASSDLVFEGISAVSTSGMSRGVTAQLHTPAKLVLIAAMFFGRVGILTALLALVPRRAPKGYRFPEGKIIIN